MMSNDEALTPLERLMRILPFGLVLALVTLNLLFWGVRIAPQWAGYTQAQADVRTAQAALTQTVVQLTAENDGDVVSLQLTHAAEQIDHTAALFLTQAQADGLVTHLYQYASVSGVQITVLQNQPTQVDSTLPYTMQMFHIEVVGDVPQLLNFIARIEELSRLSFVIPEIGITPTNHQATLTIQIELYILLNSAEYPLPLPMMTITPLTTPVVLSQSGADADITQTLNALETRLPNVAVSVPPSATITETVVMAATQQPTIASTQTPWIILQTAQPLPTQIPQQLPPAIQLVVVTQVQQVEVRVVVTATPSSTPISSTTPTLTSTATPTLSLTPDQTPTWTATFTETPTATSSATDIPTATDVSVP